MNIWIIFVIFFIWVDFLIRLEIIKWFMFVIIRICFLLSWSIFMSRIILKIVLLIILISIFFLISALAISVIFESVSFVFIELILRFFSILIFWVVFFFDVVLLHKSTIFSWRRNFRNLFFFVCVWRKIRRIRFFFVFEVLNKSLLWFIINFMFLAFGVKEEKWLIIFIIIVFFVIEVELTTIYLMLNVTFVFQLFQKRNNWNCFFWKIDVLSNFWCDCIICSDELTIQIADIDCLRMSHNRENKWEDISLIFNIFKKILLFRKFLKSENHWLSEFFDQCFTSVIDFFIKKTKSLFFQIIKIFSISYLNRIA